MKKFGIIVFIIAIIIGVVFANLISFGRSSSPVFNFSFGRSVKGSGATSIQTRDVGEFSGVDIGGVFEVNIVAGNDFAVTVEADDNLHQYIQTEVHGNVLKVSTSDSIKSRNPLRVSISAPNIEDLEASGASKVKLEGIGNSELRVDTSGASKIVLAGETATLNIDVSGASKIDASNLRAKTATVDASGASHVDVFVTDRLNSEASGASKVSYAGNPTSVEQNSSGASKIHRK